MSELGDMLKEGFDTTMDMAGGPIVIHKNYGLPQHAFREARGFKGHKDNKPSQITFMFSKDENIKIGDALQIKGARDLWRVIDVEDNVHDGVFVSFRAYVEKEGERSRQTVPAARVVINNHNSPGANFNLGGGNIHQQASWVELTSHKIDLATATTEEKQKAKSLLTKISENKLLNTIIGSAVGELTKAVLPK